MTSPLPPGSWQLELDGIAAFADSYHNLLQAIANKIQQLSATGS